MNINIPHYSVHFYFDHGVELIINHDGSRSVQQATYSSDGLQTYGKNTDFLSDPAFIEAYRAGMNSGHKIGRPKGSDQDIHIEWRVFVCCWAAWHAKHLPGDFVECGVNTGINSLAVCKYIDFNSTGKQFHLFDTFCGIPPEHISQEEEKLDRVTENARSYEECYDVARRNFAPYPNARLIRGRVPDTLASANIGSVCYLSLDMNVALPELAALEFFWDKLSPGAPVVLDDYGFLLYLPQKRTLDGFAAQRGVKVLTLPTGQGLLLKP